VKKSRFDRNMENPTVEGEIFFILSSLHNSKFMEILTLLQLFNDGKISWVDERHPYELDEKKLHKRGFG
jgi:hypothetical protein